MFKKVAKSLILGILFYSLLFVSPMLPTTSPAAAQTFGQANTIILEMSGSSDDIKDLRYGEGKIYNKISKAINSLQADGEVSENAQPIIVVVKQKKKRSMDW